MLTPSSLRRNAGGLAVCASLLLGFAAEVGAAPRAGGADFSCRASALRVTVPGQAASEPVVANANDAPCLDDTTATTTPTSTNGVTVDTATATTDVTPNDLSAAPAADGDSAVATSSITNPVISQTGAAISASVLNARASYTCQAGQPVAAGSSVVSNLVVNGQAIALPTDGAPFVLDLGPVGTLLLNQTVQAPGRITQRALELRLPADSSIANVVLAEAVADLVGNPCAPPPPPPAPCADGRDNDGDGRIDANDPGCLSGPGGTFNPGDNDETDLPQCSDARDNDGDGRVDANDPGCLSGPGGTFNPGDNDETDPPQCSDGRDNDGDGLTDARDKGCLSGPGGTYNPLDNDEKDRPNCSDGIDNDKDGRIDFPADRGCTSRSDRSEGTATGRAKLGTTPARIARAGLAGDCVSSSFSARVTGRRIRSVVFSLNGKRLRTDRQSPYTARVSTRQPGRHRVTAKVRFMADSPTSAKTRSFRYVRCAPVVRQVRFTG